MSGDGQGDTAALMLDIVVNGQVRPLVAFSTLADLVNELGHAPEGIATAVNAVFVARGRRAECVLRDGDNVTCFQAIVGG
jgi:sulfur carrier protein